MSRRANIPGTRTLCCAGNQGLRRNHHRRGLESLHRGGDGYQEGTGCFNYETDGARYIADIALWLDGVKEHPCNGEDTFKGFQLAMALLRSAVEHKIVKLPLENGENEVDAMKRVLRNNSITGQCFLLRMRRGCFTGSVFAV